VGMPDGWMRKLLRIEISGRPVIKAHWRSRAEW
jgi:hypothetical protein